MGVAQEVQEDLDQPAGVGPDRREARRRCRLDRDLAAARVGPLEEQVGRLADQRRHVQRLEDRRAAPDGRHQVLEPDLEQLRSCG